MVKQNIFEAELVEFLFCHLGLNDTVHYSCSIFSDFKYVTCGSVLKLLNPKHDVRLHSHEVKYGSGSGQQVKFAFILDENNPSLVLVG